MRAVIIILLCIIAFLILLLFLPIGLTFQYKNDIFLKVTYAGITVYNSSKPKKEKKKKEKAEQAESNDTAPAEKQENFFFKEIKKRGIKGFSEYYGKALLDVLNSVIPFVKKVKFTVFLIDLKVATTEPADTAIQYGLVCSAAYPVLSLLNEYATFKMKAVNISADFNRNSYAFSADIRVKTLLLYAVIIAIKLYKKYKSLLKENTENE